jgi:predicted nucleic acid-binding protein
VKLVLDQAALSALADPPTAAQRQVRRAMTAASRLHRDVTVPTVILSELYRGGGRNQLIDSLLSRETEALELRDTDRVLARLVGGVLAAARSGSEDLADAHVVAAAVEAGGGVILTIDVDDVRRLSDQYRTIVVERLESR